MEDSREAIFIRELVQDGRATNILGVVVASLIVTTAVFSLLAAQAHSRMTSAQSAPAAGTEWARVAEWHAEGNLAVSESGLVEFGAGRGLLEIELAPSSGSHALVLRPLDPQSDLTRLVLELGDRGGRSLTLGQDASGGYRLWYSVDSPDQALLAWSEGAPAGLRGSELVWYWDAECLTFSFGDHKVIDYPGNPLDQVDLVRIHAQAGESLRLTLKLK